jgi:ABC-type Fe3+-hydroxamate transport system substrate-binding protein
MRPLLLVPLACLALLTAGCGERPEPLGELLPYPVEVQGAGDEATRLDALPERIVALTPGAAEIVDALGVGDRLVGVPASASVSGAPNAERVTRPSGLVDVPAVVALRPDLVIAAPETREDDLDRAIRRSNAAVYVEPNESYNDVVEAVHDLGLLVGEPVEGRRLATRLRDRLGEVAGAVGGEAEVPVFVDGGLLVTVPETSLTADLVRRAGGRLVGTDAAGTALEPCEVVRLHPVVVLRLLDASATRPPGARFTGCKGGEAIRVREIPADLALFAGPRVEVALERIARLLHPDAF